MAKRNKKKLKKVYRTQVAQKVDVDSSKVDTTEIENKKSISTSSKDTNARIDSEEVRVVRKELKKIMLNLLVIIVLITVIYYINIKTDFILKIGSWLSSYLNINV